MPINYDDIMKLKSEGQEFRYTERDTMLHEHWLHVGTR